MVSGVMILLAASAMAGNPYVLIRADAPLFSMPDADEDKAKLVRNVDLDEDPSRVRYAELISRSDGWAQVRTVTYKGGCHRSLGTNAPSGMLLWVRPKDLVTVVNRPVHMTSANGTTLTLDPGVVATENVDTSFTVAVDTLRVEAKLPRDSVGKQFQPVDTVYTDFRPSHGGSGRFGTAEIAITAENALMQPGPGGTWKLERRCVRLSGPQLEGSTPTAGGGRPESRGGTARRIPHSWPAPPGTVLRWPDGVYAGESTTHYRLAKDEIEDHKGLLCGPGLTNLVICIDDPEGAPSDLPLRYADPDMKPREQTEVAHPKGKVKGESANCQVQVDVAPGGRTESVDVRGCAEEFAAATKETVATWTWKPHQVDGKNVHARTWTKVSFSE